MRGSIRVVPGTGSSPSAFGSTAASQYTADTADALHAEAAATTAGQNGHFVVAGTATQFVEVAENLPQTFTVRAGQQVTWNTLTIRHHHRRRHDRGHLGDHLVSAQRIPDQFYLLLPQPRNLPLPVPDP